MIAKGKSIAHGGRAIDYALNKEGARVIDKRFVVGGNGREIKNEFRTFQDLNGRATNKDMSFVLSPEPMDGKALTDSDLRKISGDFLERMGLGGHQAIVIKHTDREHAHLHIFANRIDMGGKAHKDSFVSKESQTIADKIAQEMGLVRARDVQALNREKTKDLRAEIYKRHQAALRHRPRDFKAYSKLMEGSGVKVVPTINKQKQLQGFRLELGGQSFKASEVHRSMTLSKMGVQKTMGKGVEKTVGTALNLNPALKIGFETAKIIVKGISRGI